MIIRPNSSNNVNTYSTQNNKNSASRQELRNVSRSNNQSDSVHFTGNTSSLFGTYFWADFFAIVAACGIVDSAVEIVNSLKEKNTKQSKFLNVLQFDYKEDLNKISELTASIIIDAKKDGGSSEQIKKVQKDFNKIFKTNLIPTASQESESINSKQKYEELKHLLKETTVDKIQNKEAYAEIVIPFLTDVSKIVKD